MQPKQRNGILAILALVAVFAMLACRHGIRLPQESESALTAEIRQALDGDTEAASKYASAMAGMQHVLNSPKVKTNDDAKVLMGNAREAMGIQHTEALEGISGREFGFLDREPPVAFDSAMRSKTEAACKRLETAFRDAAKAKSSQSVSDVLRKFADRMEARK